MFDVRSMHTTRHTPPASPSRGSGGGDQWGLRRLDPDCFLRRHEDPQDRVDQDLAAGDDHEQQREEDSRGPRFDAEASAESGTHAAQDPPLPRSDQTLLGEALVDVGHGWCTSFESVSRDSPWTPPLCAAEEIRYIG